ncbi:hypothetical protein C8Q76DRAFT_757385 [Earliella scabrosa]|nr:hypothetical protein C8Q76DRAFT_757385 [Earliella scabrosa]
MMRILSAIILTAFLAGRGTAVPIDGPEAFYETTFVTTINGTPTTIEATIDPPTFIPSVPPISNVILTSAPTFSPIFSPIVVTVDGHETTLSVIVNNPGRTPTLVRPTITLPTEAPSTA